VTRRDTLSYVFLGSDSMRPHLHHLDSSVDGRPSVRPAVLEAMTPSLRDSYLYSRNRGRPANSTAAELLRREMSMERAFVAAGGLLMAGPDPVGIGGLLPEFADQREIELLVEAAFTPVQAIRIATLNGAIYLGRQDQMGSIAVGKNADIVVMKGDPATKISDIENVETVIKDGVGYDARILLDSVKRALWRVLVATFQQGDSIKAHCR
jgi:hypothetical protein